VSLDNGECRGGDGLPGHRKTLPHDHVKEAAETLPEFVSMTVQPLPDEAKKHGISIAKAKRQFIAELEKLEPNPAKPHFMLKGQELEAKIKQYGIGKLKTKTCLPGSDPCFTDFYQDVEKGRRGLFQRRKAKSAVFAFLRFPTPC
jgi:hypothetical protein